MTNPIETLLWPEVDQTVSRNVLACLEELGEVAGALNKLADHRIDKPRTLEDAQIELAQLLACVYLLGLAIDCPPGHLERLSHEFAMTKSVELHRRTIAPWRTR